MKRAFRAFGLEARFVRDGRRRVIGFEVTTRQKPPHYRPILVRADVEGREIAFLIDDQTDVIQGEHAEGRFYEGEELALIARHFRGGVFVDIGANVGNHTLYALKVLGAEQAIAFEPIEAAWRILKCNLVLNGLQDRVEHHALGLSDREGRVGFVPMKGNLGATRLSKEAAGESIELVRGDEVLAGRRVDFLKIDTEGMELKVLAGLEETIAGQRPTIFVEVEDGHLPEIDRLAERHGYRVAERFVRYPGLTNLLLVAQGAA